MVMLLELSSCGVRIEAPSFIHTKLVGFLFPEGHPIFCKIRNIDAAKPVLLDKCKRVWAKPASLAAEPSLKSRLTARRNSGGMPAPEPAVAGCISLPC